MIFLKYYVLIVEYSVIRYSTTIRYNNSGEKERVDMTAQQLLGI